MQAYTKINIPKLIARSIFLVSILPLVFVTDLFADVVKLKDGREILGTLKEITDKGVVLEMNIGSAQGDIWFGESKIESINNLSLEEAQARLSTRNAFIIRDKDKALLASAEEGINFVTKTRKLVRCSASSY